MFSTHTHKKSLCDAMDVLNSPYRGNHFAIHTCIKSSCSTPKLTMHNISIKLENSYILKKQNRFLVALGWGSRGQGWERGKEGIWGSDAHIHYLDSGDGFKGVYLCRNLSNCTLQMCASCCKPIIPS